MLVIKLLIYDKILYNNLEGDYKKKYYSLDKFSFI